MMGACTATGTGTTNTLTALISASMQPRTFGMLQVSKRPSGGFNVQGKDDVNQTLALEVDATGPMSLSCPTNVDLQMTGATGRFYSGGFPGSTCVVRLVVYGGAGTRAAGCFEGTLKENGAMPTTVPITGGLFDVAVPQ